MSLGSDLPRWLAVGVFALSAVGSSAAPLYFNGFETDTSGWPAGATRVASGTGGITSATGSYHATVAAGAYTNFGGYNYGAGNAVPTAFQPYRTAVDIYLDVGTSAANDTRFDYTSAINNSSGTHLRDFAFNIGFYDDATGPGAGTDRFVVSASNNTGRSNSFPKNPARDPFAISATGWYTFQHTFYDNGGVLAVDLEIFDASDALLADWTLSSASDVISGVGGNRYGWFPNIESGLAPLAIDNSLLEITPRAVPEPATLLLVGSGLVALSVRRRRRL